LRDKERLNLVLLIHQFLSFVYMYDGHSEGVADRCNGSALRARLAAGRADVCRCGGSWVFVSNYHICNCVVTVLRLSA
jgi:hypothetical protein